MDKCKGLFRTQQTKIAPNIKLFKSLSQSNVTSLRPYQLKQIVIFDTIPVDEATSSKYWWGFLKQEAIIVHDPSEITLAPPFKNKNLMKHKLFSGRGNNTDLENIFIKAIALHKTSVENKLSELKQLIQTVQSEHNFFESVNQITKNYKQMIRINQLIDIHIVEREFLISALRNTIGDTSKSLANKKKINQTVRRVWQEDINFKERQIFNNNELAKLFDLGSHANFIFFTGLIIDCYLSYFYHLRTVDKINKSQEIQRVNDVIEATIQIREERLHLINLKRESLKDTTEYVESVTMANNIKNTNNRFKSMQTELNRLHTVDILSQLQLSPKGLFKKQTFSQPFKKRM